MPWHNRICLAITEHVCIAVHSCVSLSPHSYLFACKVTVSACWQCFLVGRLFQNILHQVLQAQCVPSSPELFPGLHTDVAAFENTGTWSLILCDVCAPAHCVCGAASYQNSDSVVQHYQALLLQVLVGTHVLLANGGIMAPVGTHVVALAARHHRCPFVVLTGLHKLSPLFPHDPSVNFNEFRVRHCRLKYLNAMLCFWI